MSTVEALRALFDEILREAAGNPRFGTRLADVLSEAVKSSPATEKPRRRGRRAPGALDPLEVYSEGEAELRRRLEKLDIEQLKDIVAQHGMDSSKLATKWKNAGRLINLIVTTVQARVSKGDAFRAT